ncbi:hypothetical protein [Halobacteriovorax sp. HLS]|uniref:hypothetical protein n=1 Tax=Halobacteriovorax sp. HLS TaxID=2234000 RepID=UPI000FD7F11A|nr:hypothetical protein [Halobacteriovorax sp. HLS]
MKLTIFLIVAAFFSACGSTSRNIAPDLEFVLTKKGKIVGGTVVYNPYGIDQLTRMRRNKAVQRMRGHCHPAPYQIVKEETLSPEEKDKKYGGNMKVLIGSKLRFIDFECVYPK